jgi:hypothetical protein
MYCYTYGMEEALILFFQYIEILEFDNNINDNHIFIKFLAEYIRICYDSVVTSKASCIDSTLDFAEQSSIYNVAI